MAINVSVQCNGGFLLDIILLTQCSTTVHNRGTRLNAMKRFSPHRQNVSPFGWIFRRFRCVKILLNPAPQTQVVFPVSSHKYFRFVGFRPFFTGTEHSWKEIIAKRKKWGYFVLKGFRGDTFC